jgi:hypothetical protein|tara:strand:+ start:863 stop:1444 length:582 start_codon:yes stop_codon:yes gene_type:complete
MIKGSIVIKWSIVQMLSPVLVSVAAIATPEPAYAQTSGATGVLRYGHVFVSNGAKLRRLGGTRSMLYPGLGFEWRYPRGLGLGFEAGPRFEDHALTRLDDLMVSVDVSYHGRSSPTANAVVPFLGGGLSVGWEPVPDGQQTYFVNAAGGVTYWLDRRRGLRFELRDAVTIDRPQNGYHHLGFRVGYTWLMGRQ